MHYTIIFNSAYTVICERTNVARRVILMVKHFQENRSLHRFYLELYGGLRKCIGLIMLNLLKTIFDTKFPIQLQLQWALVWHLAHGHQPVWRML